MAYFICEKQGRCCPHEFYDSIEQAISDSEDGVPCDHLIEVAPVRHGRNEAVSGRFREGENRRGLPKSNWLPELRHHADRQNAQSGGHRQGDREIHAV